MVTHNLIPTYDVILSWWISLKTDEEAGRRTFTRLSDCESRGVLAPDMEIIAALLPSDGDIDNLDKKEFQRKIVEKFEKNYTALWSSILTPAIKPEWERNYPQRTVSPELVENFKEAITSDPLFAEKVLNNLRGAEKLGVIHPDMEIINTISPLTQPQILRKFSSEDANDVLKFFRRMLDEG